MYAEQNENCPVKSLQLLIQKLHNVNPDCTALFQYPNTSYNITGIWFNKMPVGKNTLSTLMKRISEKAQLSQIYTNHSIRATSITLLSNAGIDSTSISHVSGHKTIDSLKHYIQRPSEQQCKNMSNMLHQKATGITEKQPQQTDRQKESTTSNIQSSSHPGYHDQSSALQPFIPNQSPGTVSTPAQFEFQSLKTTTVTQTNVHHPTSWPISFQGAVFNGNVTFNVTN